MNEYTLREIIPFGYEFLWGEFDIIRCSNKNKNNDLRKDTEIFLDIKFWHLLNE